MKLLTVILQLVSNPALLLCLLPSMLRAQPLPAGPYFGQEPPGLEPKVFAPGLISLAERRERHCVFSHDGTECYLTVILNGRRQILVSEQVDGQWTEFALAPFSDLNTHNSDPALSADDQTIVFIRVIYLLGGFDTNIFITQRTQDGWTEPIEMPEPISNFAADWEPSMTNEGAIYYSTYAQGWETKLDIWRLPPTSGGYDTLEHVVPLNTAYTESGACIAPDESWIIFHSDRPGGHGGSDLYISFHRADDSWTTPRNLGPTINTSDNEETAVLSPDEKYLLFKRHTNAEDIYWVDMRAILPDPNGPIENQNSTQRFGSIQFAIDCAKPGDIIMLEPGVYQERIHLNKDIVLQSVDPNNPYYVGGTIIQGNTDDPVLSLSNNSVACEIAGLTLRAGTIGIMGAATNATLRHCRIMDNLTHGVELSQVSSPYLLHCLIVANGKSGILMHATDGRRTKYCEPMLENCTIVDNSEGGIVGGQPVIVDSVIQGL